MEGTSAEQLQQVEQEYQQKRAEIEQQMKERGELGAEAPSPTEHETMSQVIEGAIQQHVPEFKASSHTTTTDDSLPPDAQEKIQGWVNIAFTKSLAEGIKTAKDSNDIALIDAFHSALTGNLYQMLVEQKRVEVVK
ncbi:MAG: hypothetical protein A2735_01980 [Candidatus Yanofskybacteria bacterium RIFCSPHIGHO2_01_FULL_41_21]|uniref:Uncharacterized protein n=1 Tax=Candidatus Yanofskybacteria bacterium RIFCSPHIGHO2_01_FULL_41_21 TaxID=1802660 RepID=A0A1F8E9R8_9BACT|nr:MAG: hypothetical protein A2735_01980 [Candidatus Yanofskybacteria bacterium RIFCSPHIGHO2_01_FULL_41_21]